MTRLLSLEVIQVPKDRIRRDLDGERLHELANSIAKQGLFHPLLLRDDGVTLVAGERRLRAITRLLQHGVQIRFDRETVPLGQVPVVHLSDADAAALLEAELNENLIRHQLTWQEQAAAVAALHKLRLAANPKYRLADLRSEVATGKPHDGPVHSTPSGGQYQVMKEDLLVSEFLNDPEVSKAKTKKEALALVEKKLVTMHRAALAKEFGAIVQTDTYKLIKGDLFDILPTLPDAFFDCIIADPPYGISADTFDNQGAVEHEYKDSPEYSSRVYTYIAAEGWRICKREAHAYLFCDPRRAGEVSRIFRTVGWEVWPWPLVWPKPANVGILPRPEHGPRRCYETLIFANKGDRRVTGVYPDVLAVSHDRSTERGAHKPSELYRDLIERSCFPGDRVLDPCCGTGPLFDAAKRQNVFAVGIECEEAAYAIALERIRAL